MPIDWSGPEEDDESPRDRPNNWDHIGGAPEPPPPSSDSGEGLPLVTPFEELFDRWAEKQQPEIGDQAHGSLEMVLAVTVVQVDEELREADQAEASNDFLKAAQLRSVAARRIRSTVYREVLIREFAQRLDFVQSLEERYQAQVENVLQDPGLFERFAEPERVLLTSLHPGLEPAPLLTAGREAALKSRNRPRSSETLLQDVRTVAEQRFNPPGFLKGAYEGLKRKPPWLRAGWKILGGALIVGADAVPALATGSGLAPEGMAVSGAVGSGLIGAGVSEALKG